MRLSVLLLTILGLLPECCASTRDDLLRLCDFAEGYYRAEARLVSAHDALLGDFAQLLLDARLRAISVLRHRVVEATTEGSAASKITEGALCGFSIGKDDPWLAMSAERRAIATYVQNHSDISGRYDVVSGKLDDAILKEAKMDRCEYNRILNQYVPDEDSEPNPESCVRPERSGAVNTTHVEQAREDRRR